MAKALDDDLFKEIGVSPSTEVGPRLRLRFEHLEGMAREVLVRENVLSETGADDWKAIYAAAKGSMDGAINDRNYAFLAAKGLIALRACRNAVARRDIELAVLMMGDVERNILACGLPAAREGRAWAAARRKAGPASAKRRSSRAEGDYAKWRRTAEEILVERPLMRRWTDIARSVQSRLGLDRSIGTIVRGLQRSGLQLPE